jgi:hypothetical protein
VTILEHKEIASSLFPDSYLVDGGVLILATSL